MNGTVVITRHSNALIKRVVTIARANSVDSDQIVVRSDGVEVPDWLAVIVNKDLQAHPLPVGGHAIRLEGECITELGGGPTGPTGPTGPGLPAGGGEGDVPVFYPSGPTGPGWVAEPAPLQPHPLNDHTDVYASGPNAPDDGDVLTFEPTGPSGPGWYPDASLVISAEARMEVADNFVHAVGPTDWSAGTPGMATSNADVIVVGPNGVTFPDGGRAIVWASAIPGNVRSQAIGNWFLAVNGVRVTPVGDDFGDTQILNLNPGDVVNMVNFDAVPIPNPATGPTGVVGGTFKLNVNYETLTQNIAWP